MNIPDELPRLLLLCSLLLPWLVATINSTVIASPTGQRALEFLTFGVLTVLFLTMLGCLGRDLLLGVRFPEISVGWRLPGLSDPGVLLSLSNWRVDPLNGGVLALLPMIAMTASRFTPGHPHVRRLWLPLLGGMIWTLCAGDPATLSIGVLVTAISLVSRMSHLGEQGTRRMATSFLTFQTLGWMPVLAAVGLLTAIAALVRSAPHGLPGRSDPMFVPLGRILHGSISQHPAAQLLWEQYQGIINLTLAAGGSILAGLYPFHGGLGRSLERVTPVERLWLVGWSQVSLVAVIRLAMVLLPEFPDKLRSGAVCYLILGGIAVALFMVRDASRSRSGVMPMIWMTHQLALAAFLLPTAQWPILASLIPAIFAVTILTTLLSADTLSPNSAANPDGPLESCDLPTLVTQARIASVMAATALPLILSLTMGWLALHWLQVAEIGIWIVPLVLMYCLSHLLRLAAALKDIERSQLPGTRKQGAWTLLWLTVSLVLAGIPPLFVAMARLV